MLPSLLASIANIIIATMFRYTNNIACNSSLEAMITTATKVATIKATIFSKSINDNKTVFYLVKVNHLRAFSYRYKHVSKVSG